MWEILVFKRPLLTNGQKERGTRIIVSGVYKYIAL